jgi:flagellar biosynthesis protein FlhG
MNWEQARRLLHFRRSAEAAASRTGEASPRRESLGVARAASLCVASGKGGTGKSVTTASLAARFARLGRTLIVDADMGIGNAHILQGVSPDRSFVELVAGTASPREVIASCGPGLDLIAAGSGVSKMAELSAFEMHRIAEALEHLETGYQHLLVDSAAGVSSQTVTLAAASDLCLLVTTPAVTAMTDAYAFLKVLLRSAPDAEPLLVVNRARDLEQARSVVARMETVSRRFLGRSPRWIGWVPEDEAVMEAVNARAAVVRHAPGSPAALALDHLGEVLEVELARVRHRGLGRSLMGRVVHSPRLA